jgi:hypothetical protein
MSMHLRALHDELRRDVLELEASTLKGDLSQQIEVGSILREIGDSIAGVLDRIKESIREHAIRRSGGRSGTLNFAGTDLGEATVNIPEASLKLAQGKSIEDLRRALGEDFEIFFEEITTHKPRKDFETRMAALQDAAQHRVLLAAVERVEATPRVGFKRGGVNKPERDDTT